MVTWVLKIQDFFEKELEGERRPKEGKAEGGGRLRPPPPPLLSPFLWWTIKKCLFLGGVVVMAKREVREGSIECTPALPIYQPDAHNSLFINKTPSLTPLTKCPPPSQRTQIHGCSQCDSSPLFHPNVILCSWPPLPLFATWRRYCLTWPAGTDTLGRSSCYF